MKTPGQIAYEEDCKRQPYYPGQRRTAWPNLHESDRVSWERNPTVRAPVPDKEKIAALVSALEDVLPYAIACIGLPRPSWPSDSVILKAEAAIQIVKGSSA